MAEFDASGRGRRQQQQRSGVGPQSEARLRSQISPQGKSQGSAQGRVQGRQAKPQGKAQGKPRAKAKGKSEQKKSAASSFINSLWIYRNSIVKAGVFVILILFFISIARQSYELYELHSEQKALEKQIVELKKQNEELKKTSDDLHNLQTVESIARDQLGLTKPGEVPYVK